MNTSNTITPVSSTTPTPFDTRTSSTSRDRQARSSLQTSHSLHSKQSKSAFKQIRLYARGLSDGLPKMIANEGFGTLYASIVPLWARQVPYTIIKFVAFERIAEAIYARLPKPKSEMSQVEQMGVVFTAGYAAGILCGAVSHPADTMVSKINKVQMEGSIMDKAQVHLHGNSGETGHWIQRISGQDSYRVSS